MDRFTELNNQLNDVDDKIDNIKEKKAELKAAKELLSKEMKKFQKEG